MIECKFKDKPEGAYHYTMCGLDYVYLTNGYDIDNDPEYGETVSIHNAEKLHVEIGKNIVKHKEKLSSQELRFLRSMLDLTQKELAEKLKMSLRQVQRWESINADEEPSFAAESWIRIIFWEKFIGKSESAEEFLDNVKKQREHYKYLSFMESKQEWKLIPAIAV